MEAPKERVDINLSLSHCGCIFFWLLFTRGLFLDLSLVTVPGSSYRIEKVGSSTSARFKSRPVNRLCWMRVLWLVTHRAAPDQTSSLKFTMNASSPVLSSSPIAIMMRPATSTQVFLGFPVSASECWDGSQVSKSLLHASHVALPT